MRSILLPLTTCLHGWKNLLTFFPLVPIYITLAELHLSLKETLLNYLSTLATDAPGQLDVLGHNLEGEWQGV